jgi:hypothetical protein
MFMLPMMAAGALLGAAKNNRAQQQESSDRKLASETQRYSPWTGMSAGPIRHAGSMLGDVLGGGLGGAMTSQSFGGEAAAGAPGVSEASTGPLMGDRPNLAAMGNSFQMPGAQMQESPWDKMPGFKMGQR